MAARTTGLGDPADAAYPVTPADNTALPKGLAKGLYIGGTGDVVIRLNDTGHAVTATFKAVPVGTTLSIKVWGVDATLTTATNILALY